MHKKAFALAVVLLTIPMLIYAGNTGKVRGRVIDKDTKDPIPGVAVILEGTMMGAATDINGYYIILNVPVGTYSVRAQMMGYQTVVISNKRVSADLTTECDFELSPTVLEGQVVTIVAERPIIEKHVTNTVKTIQAEDLQNIPIRGVAVAMQLSSAVVDGQYVRGSRNEETVTYIDGVMTSRLRDGAANVASVINNAIEEVTFQAGGFNAEYGFANAGVLWSTTKTGQKEYHFNIEAISDEVFKGKNGRTLGTQSWGYNTYTVTASGPVPFTNDNLRFFVAGERNYNGGYAVFNEGFVVDTVIVWGKGTANERAFPFKAELKPGPYPGYSYRSWDMNSNLVWDVRPVRVKVGANYHWDRSQGGATWGNIVNYKKNGVTISNNQRYYLNVTHQVNPRLFYTANLGYFRVFSEYGDPDLWDEYWKYADPQYNVGPDGNTVLRGWGLTYTLSLYGLITLQPTGLVTSGYGKSEQVNFGPKLDLVWQFNNWNELKTGFEYNYYTIRRYDIPAFTISKALHDREIDPSNKQTDYDIYRSNISHYGYDIWGNPTSKDTWYDATDDQGRIGKVNGHDAPKHPIRAAFYIQDKVELKDLILNAGVRVDYLTTGTLSYKDPRNLILNAWTLVDDQSFGPERQYWKVSPRLGWSFPVTDRTVFHAQFGKFVQLPRLDDLYDTHGLVGRFLQGGNARTMPNPNLKPEQTTQYEVGLKQQLGENASLMATVFYKDIRDYIQIRVTLPEPGLGYGAFYELRNIDFGTTTGVTFALNLRRTKRIAATLDYTYSKAMGTGSSSRDHFDIAWQDQNLRFPTIITPLQQNQDHVGNVNLDFRLTKDDGPVVFGVRPLANLGANLLFTMHSGSRYTKIEPGPGGLFAQNAPRPLEALNSSVMPWYYRTDLKVDKTVEISRFKIRPYIWVYNLFNRKNVTGVYRQTGEPHDNGWFLTEDGKAWAEIYGSKGVYYAKKALSGAGATNLATPRILRFGLMIDY
ncbi:MAG: TonB-dependent receptor [candidate division KSB1 bacterium]|nr:TonB-dependent receptor [candidate division KSB1 bacterium]